MFVKNISCHSMLQCSWQRVAESQTGFAGFYPKLDTGLNNRGGWDERQTARKAHPAA